MDNSGLFVLFVLLVATLSFTFIQKKESYLESVEEISLKKMGLDAPLSAPSSTPASGELVFQNAGGIVLNSNNYSQAIRLTGTATPITLDIIGTGTTTNQIQFYINSSAKAAFDANGLYMVDGMGIFLGTNTNYLAITHASGATTMNYTDSITFQKSGTGVLTMDSTGNVSVNGLTSLNGAVTIGTSSVKANLTVNGVTTNINGNLNVVGSISYYGNPLLPIGSIIMFYSTLIPAGWVLCNGQSVPRTDGGGLITTPNLVGSFVYGGTAPTTTQQGNTTGNATLTTANLPAHSHGITDPGHYHSYYSAGYTAVNVLLPAPIPPGTATGICPQQTSTGNWNTTNFNCGYIYPISKYDAVNTGSAYKLGSDGSPIYDSSNNAVAGTNISINNTGSGTAFSIMPPYIVLCYIMKV